jgi:PAS domain S-box-containing protein
VAPQTVIEVKRLKACINDLMVVVAHPAIWSGGEPSQIICTLGDVLLSMLSLDLVYVRLKDGVGKAPIGMVRIPQSRKLKVRPQEIGDVFTSWLGDDPHKWPPLVRNRIGELDISIIPLRLGMHGEMGVIVAGSQRVGFPEETERLLLSVAANQATIGLQGARLLGQQKRIADELDQRVEQRTAELAAANEELKMEIAERRRLVDANIIGTFIWKAADPRVEANDIVVIEANDAFLCMVGYDRGDLAAGRLSGSILTPPEWYERDAQTVLEVKTMGTVQPFEKEYLRKDGSRVPVLVGIAAFDEQLDQGVAFVVDLTERKRAEAEAGEAQMELAHANRVAAIGQLSASIGHEIHQPLSGIITNAETGLLWLKTEPPNVQEAVGAFSRVVRDGKRASEIVNRIRALVKKAPPRKDKLHINEAIHEVLGLTRSEAAKNGVLVQTQLGEKLPPIQGDRVQLQQVILNLVMNAVEAIGSGNAGPREILIETARTESDDILVSVRDTGPGLNRANIERMFDAFYTTKADGLGLGLSICRSIIEAHGGKLWATPGTPRGAVFRFVLPGEQR